MMVSRDDQESLQRFAIRAQKEDERSELIASPPSGLQRSALWLIAGTLLITLSILYFGQLDIVVPAIGRIVPTSKAASVTSQERGLMIEVHVANKDIGLVFIGTKARVKVDAYPFRDYGTLPAQVVEILSPDATDNTIPVQLKLMNTRLLNGSAEARIFAGLTVQAELVTTRKRLLTLLFD